MFLLIWWIYSITLGLESEDLWFSLDHNICPNTSLLPHLWIGKAFRPEHNRKLNQIFAYSGRFTVLSIEVERKQNYSFLVCFQTTKVESNRLSTWIESTLTMERNDLSLDRNDLDWNDRSPSGSAQERSKKSFDFPSTYLSSWIAWN